MWERIKTWFKDSETIFWARLQTISGVLVGGMAVMNWAPLVALGSSAGLTAKQIIILSGILLTQGIVTEIARRARDPEMK